MVSFVCLFVLFAFFGFVCALTFWLEFLTATGLTNLSIWQGDGWLQPYLDKSLVRAAIHRLHETD